MPAPTDEIPPISATPSRAAKTKPQPAAFARWENEGGHPPPGLDPTDVSQPAPTGPGGGETLAAMRDKFLSDFANGRIGTHHNSFQHRARVLRQLTAAEEGDAASASGKDLA